MTKIDTFNPEDWDLWDTWMTAQRLLVRDIDRRLQAEFGISKAEFSVFVTLLRAPNPEMRVVELSESLGWEKSRVAHLLSRMEVRGFLLRTEGGTGGRRTGIGLTPEGRKLATSAISGHAKTIRRQFLDALSAEQAAAIRAWSEGIIENMGGDLLTP